MPKKRYTPEEIIQHLRTVELETGKGLAVLDACRKLGITEQTYYRWKKEYGGLRVDQAKRLKTLEQENQRLKRIVADHARFHKTMPPVVVSIKIISIESREVLYLQSRILTNHFGDASSNPYQSTG